jgi:hypothetical protein
MISDFINDDPQTQADFLRVFYMSSEERKKIKLIESEERPCHVPPD